MDINNPKRYGKLVCSVTEQTSEHARSDRQICSLSVSTSSAPIPVKRYFGDCESALCAPSPEQLPLSYTTGCVVHPTALLNTLALSMRDRASVPVRSHTLSSLAERALFLTHTLMPAPRAVTRCHSQPHTR
eukprot:5964159-Pleurochrysis_carterae.AAC.2